MAWKRADSRLRTNCHFYHFYQSGKANESYALCLCVQVEKRPGITCWRHFRASGYLLIIQGPSFSFLLSMILMSSFCRFSVLCLQYNYIAVIMASGLCGFFRSTIVVNQNLVVSEYCKEDESKLPAALGLNMVMKGISIISIGQLLGWIRDYTGSYYLCIYAQNSLLGVIIALWTPELVYKYVKDKKR